MGRGSEVLLVRSVSRRSCQGTLVQCCSQEHSPDLIGSTERGTVPWTQVIQKEKSGVTYISSVLGSNHGIQIPLKMACHTSDVGNACLLTKRMQNKVDAGREGF